MKKNKGLLAESLHILVLFNLGVAQTLYEVLGKYGDLFASHRSRPIDIIALVFIFSAALPGFLIFVEWGAGLFSERLKKSLHSVWMASLKRPARISVMLLRDAVSSSF